MSDILAIAGGTPIRRAGTWPSWPQPGLREEAYVNEVLRNARLTVRAHWRQGSCFDDRLSRSFAQYHECRYAIPVNSGTTAIEVALDALGIGAGDEVIIPSLTWIATAVAVLRLNATPVFADVDPQTFTLDPAAIVAGLTPRTAAIVVVHWHCTVAAMDLITDVARQHGLALVEDCAQAHGARYHGRMVGTWGNAGAFSFHNDKLISAGEGGIVTTDSEACFNDAQALRLDGFDWSPKPFGYIDGPYAQGQGGRILGTSLALPEISCALAVAGLERLATETRLREANGERLSSILDGIDGFAAIPRSEGVNIRPFYEFSVRITGGTLAEARIETVCKALAAELGFPVYPEIDALTRNALYKPEARRRYAHNVSHLGTSGQSRFFTPVAERAAAEVLMFLHPPLLGEPEDINDIAAAFAKVSKHAAELVKMERTHDTRLTASLAYWIDPTQIGVTKEKLESKSRD